MLPATVRSLFWDIDTATFNPEAFPQYTIERVLELGDERAVEWLHGVFPPETIAATLRASRRLSRRSANFWALVMEVPREEVRALQSTVESAHLF